MIEGGVDEPVDYDIMVDEWEQQFLNANMLANDEEPDHETE